MGICRWNQSYYREVVGGEGVQDYGILGGQTSSHSTRPIAVTWASHCGSFLNGGYRDYDIKKLHKADSWPRDQFRDLDLEWKCIFK